MPKVVRERIGVFGLGGRGPNRVVQGKEDCLTLAVFTPTTRPGKRLPVAVFIHGGAFIYGDYTAIGPQHLLDRDVVLVALSYRLSTLGFLCLDLPSAPGNVGLLDQILGLTWVRDHISAFGGDPGRVTVMGESAGSASVSLLLLSPLSSGLFHRAVMMSGVWPAAWTHNSEPARSAQLIARELGCPKRPEKLLYCLRYKRTMEQIVTATEKLRRRQQKQGSLGTFLTAPCSQSPGPHQVVPQSLDSSDHLAFLNRVPVFIGTVRDEGNLFAGLAWVNFFLATGKLENREYFREQFMRDLLNGVQGVNSTEMSRPGQSVEELLQIYFSPSELGRPAAIMPGLSRIMGRFIMNQPSYELGLLLASHVPVYMYSFDYLGDNSLIEYLLPPKEEGEPPLNPGVNHSDDLLYLFDLGVIQLSNKDARARRTMVATMAAFISGSSPHPGLRPLSPHEDAGKQKFLSIRDSAFVETDYTRTFYRGYGENRSYG